MSAPFICEGCGRHPSDGTTVFRVNPKGVRPGRWRCLPCLADLPRAEWPSEQTQQIVAEIERKQGRPVQ